MMAPAKKKSLQDVLRERRQAAPLLTARELRDREAARRREEIAEEVSRLLDRRHRARTPVDADGKLALELYRAIFASSRGAYYESRHWSRRSLAQRKATPFCEIERCGRSDGLRAHHLNHDTVGEEARRP